jgi:predicted NAD-dependent protein-ADP-ribosyltransferase YbiA (DUF1768 family)
MPPPNLLQVRSRYGISSFTGEYRWLSNFWECYPIVYEDLTFETIENAYQASKTFPRLRSDFIDISPGAAKKLGKKVPLRPAFSANKLSIMRFLCEQKFGREPLRTCLMETAPKMITEGNIWGDVYWGMCNGRGQNHLGRIIMDIREKLLAE